MLEHIELSLKRLRTDYIDILQLHNPSVLPDTENPHSTYGAMAEAKRRGWIRFLGVTNHALSRAETAVLSGKYDTVQYPFCMLASPRDEALVRLCEEQDVGFIAMKGMSGGLIRDARAAWVYMRRYPNVIPIWGIQRMSELEEFLSYEQNPPADDGEVASAIVRECQELSGDFCRGCGYCLPCPAGIAIPVAARRKFFLMRAPLPEQMSEEMLNSMLKINDCRHCNQCATRCPYELNPPRMLQENLAYYLEFYKKYHEQ